MTTGPVTLLELQRRMAGAIMTPLPGRRLVRAEAEALIKRNSRLTSAQRLEIYRESYWCRVLGSFEDDFPGLRAVLGPRLFHRMAQAYLAEVPSASFSIRDLGARLHDWLQKHPEYMGPHAVLALDMARLEWAHIEAFDGAQEKPLGPEDLIELHDAMVFAVQPHISLLDFSFPVDDIRINGRRGRVKPAPVFIAVHRIKFIVYYRRLEEDEFRILTALRSGVPIGEAVSLIKDESQSKLEAWFASWTRMGWLCRPEINENSNEKAC